MAVYGFEILGNDTSNDVYNLFYEKYNNGGLPPHILKSLFNEYIDELNDNDEKNNVLFALALAAWETNSLNDELYQNVKKIIDSENDITVWENLGSDSEMLENRKQELIKFLDQISSPIQKKIRRKKEKIDYFGKIVFISQPEDKRCTLTVTDEYINKKYVQSGAVLMWEEGGGAIFYYEKPDASITAKWIKKNRVLIIHEDGLKFTKKEDETQFRGDKIYIEYQPIEEKDT